MKSIYLLSNINIDSLSLYNQNYKIEKSTSFNSIISELVDLNSIVYGNDFDYIFVYFDYIEATREECKLFIQCLSSNLSKINAKVILSTSPVSYYNSDSYLHITYKNSIKFNSDLLKLAHKHNLPLLNIDSLYSEYGKKAFIDEKFWYLGRIKFSSFALKLIASELENLIDGYENKIKKVLVCDLDNTLWGGIVAEDKNNIELSNEKIGKIYLDLQKQIKLLKSYGVLLAINSKNNQNDALFGLNHKNSVLKKNDFIVIKANWNDKASNIIDIANELNLGLESIVFIDDNIVERDYVKSTIPEVEVPEFPDDIFTLNSWFAKDVVMKYFPKTILNKEDKKKYKQYKANHNRQKLEKSTTSYKDYIGSLNIKLEYTIDSKEQVQRISQLTQKTNQFNLTTRRYTQKEIEQFINSKDCIVIAIEYKDKFNNEGIIGVVILKYYNTTNVEIDTFLLSCRVLKRDIEYQILDYIEMLLKNKDCKQIDAKYIKTDKNIQVKDLYLTAGFVSNDNNKFIKKL